MNLTEYIRHPERLDNASLEALREWVRRYPYFHAARLLLLRNLFQLHHEDFGEELRRTAHYVPDRRAVFRLIEERNYVPEPVRKHTAAGERDAEERRGGDRTVSLIDTFLSALPEEKPRKVRTADATTDYMAYLMQTEGVDAEDEQKTVPMHHQNLIDDFIDGPGNGRIVLSDDEGGEWQVPVVSDTVDESDNEDFFTETLARIYIKQGKYAKAIEIIRRLSLKVPKKNRYFADQIRFLEKLIINNKYK